MNGRIWFFALAMSGSFLTAHAQTCGLRDNGATMTDPVTGMEIQKCAVGQTWTGNQCTGQLLIFSWNEAMQRFSTGPWRLMTEKESKMLAPDGGRAVCKLGATLTSTLFNSDTSWAVTRGLSRWGDGPVQYDYGSIKVNDKGMPVQLVRASQSAR